MDRWTKLALWVAGATAAALALSSSSAANPNDDGGDMAKASPKVRMWRKLAWLPMLTNEQRFFLMLTAKGEGNYNPAAHNGSESERAASANAADSEQGQIIVQRAMKCGVAPEKFRTGSWTTFQFLAPYVAGNAFEIWGNSACPFVDPTKIASNLNAQICMAIEHARDLQQYNGWQQYPTVGNLRLGWASPGFMGYIQQQAERLQKYRELAAAESFTPGIVDAQLTEFPGNVAAIYELLRSGGPP